MFCFFIIYMITSGDFLFGSLLQHVVFYSLFLVLVGDCYRNMFLYYNTLEQCLQNTEDIAYSSEGSYENMQNYEVCHYFHNNTNTFVRHTFRILMYSQAKMNNDKYSKKPYPFFFIFFTFSRKIRMTPLDLIEYFVE